MAIEEKLCKPVENARVLDRMSDETFSALRIITGRPPGGLMGKSFYVPKNGRHYVVSFDNEGYKHVKEAILKEDDGPA